MKKSKKTPPNNSITTIELEDILNTPQVHGNKKAAARLKAMKDEDIDFSDIPPISDDIVSLARILRPSPKETITIRLDKEVLKWFKEDGDSYQSHINAALKAYMIGVIQKSSTHIPSSNKHK